MKKCFIVCNVCVIFVAISLGLLFQFLRIDENVPSVEHWKGIPVAHRAGKGFGCENTIYAMKKAHEMGAKAIEIDVQMTKDHKPIVIHNVKLEGVSDGIGLITDTLLQDFESLNLLFEPQYDLQNCKTHGKIPTLEKILDLALELDLLVLIDSKEMIQRFELADEIVEMISDRKMFEKTLVGSFDPQFLYRLRRLDERVATILFTFPQNGFAALCANRYVIPKWSVVYSALCVAAPLFDFVLDWWVAQSFTQQLVGASIVGQHWMAFDIERNNSGPTLNHNYQGPAFAYVVNDELIRNKFLTHNITVMTDCVQQSCDEDILDPIVRRATAKN